MKTIKRLAALLACGLGMAVAVPALDAQTTRPPGHRRSWDPGSLSVSVGGSGHRSPVVEASGSRLRTSDARTPDDQTSDAQASEIRFSRPILRIGQAYTLRANDVVRDLYTVFADLTLEGRVENDAVAILGDAHLKGAAVVDQALIVVGGSATIDQGAVVNGDLVVIGGTLTAPPGFSPGGEHVVVGSPALGDALNSMVPWITRGLLWGRLIVPDITWIWVLVGVTFLVYLALNLLFGRPARVCADAVAARPFSTFLLGLLVLILTVPALVILSATVIGLAVVPFVLCAMLVGGLIGKVGVDRAIGRSLLPESSPDSRLQSSRSFLLGFVLIGLAYMVPVVGVVTWALTAVLAVGAAAAMLRAMLRREHPAKPRAVAPAPAAAATGPAASSDRTAALEARASGWEGTSQGSEPEAPAPSVEPSSAVESAASYAAASPEPPVRPSTSSGRTEMPPPLHGTLLAYPRASFLDRVAAFALDCILVAIAVQVLDLFRHGSFPLMLFIYHVGFWAWKGTTLGGIVVGLRVIRTAGNGPRFVDALVRGLASILSLAALGIGCFWMLQDSERQMWHDKIAGTYVVKVPREVALA